jgi:cardiolipin synthase A/B
MMSGHLLAIINFLLTLIFVSFILRSKRPPGNTLAWLFFIVIIPYIGIPLYIFLSGRKFTGRLAKKENIFDPISQRENKSRGDVESLLASLGAPSARDNSKLSLILNGQEAYNKIVEVINSAQKSIHLTTFIFANDPVGLEILNLLKEKARQGVSVKLLLDSMGALWVRNPSLGEMRKAGGQVAFFMPLLHIPFRGRFNLRNHRKILVIDSEKALIGGMNIAQEYLGPAADPNRWVDLALNIEGPSVLDLETIFTKDWEFATNGK